MSRDVPTQLVPVVTIMARWKTAPSLLAHRSVRDKHPDIAVVPIGAETAAGGQFVVTEPLSAKVSHGQAAAKMEERRVKIQLGH